MKNRNLIFMILGIGVGITLCSIFFIMNPTKVEKEYTEDQIKERAADYGYGDVTALLEANTDLKQDIKKLENDIELKNKEIELLKKENNLINTDSKAATTSSVEKTEASGAEISNEEISNEEISDDEVMVVIKKGESSQDVVNKLYDKKLVEDKEKFSHLLYNLEATKKIQYGKFILKKSLTDKEIIKEITTLK